MGAFGRFFSKEVTEFLRTWRLPVLGGAILFFALSGPILALLTPEILKSVTAGQAGVVFKVPDPTWRDAYYQWTKNLSQIGAFVAITLAAGSVASELSSGTAVLVLTKPVSRSAFVVAKTVALIGLIAVTVALGTGITQAITAVVFGKAPGAGLWLATAAWMAFVALLVAITVLFSTLMPTLAAAGVGIVVFLVMSTSTLFEPVVRYTPVGLLAAPNAVIAGKDVALGWPVATTLLAVVLFTAAAAAAFSRREI